MERYFKRIIRDSKGFLGILRDNSFSGRALVRQCYRPLYSIFALLLLLFFSPSCDTGSEIGDRFGRWQITTIQTPDSIATPCDLFMDFQSDVHVAHVLFEDEHRTLALHGLARQEGDSLYITYMPMDGVGATMRDYLSRRFLIEDDYRDVRFHIQQLDGSQMILTKGNHRWELRAY